MSKLKEENKQYKSDITELKAMNDKEKKIIIKLQLTLRNKEKELVECKKEHRAEMRRIEDQNEKLKSERVELIYLVQRYTHKNSSLEAKLNRKCDGSNKENCRYENYKEEAFD